MCDRRKRSRSASSAVALAALTLATWPRIGGAATATCAPADSSAAIVDVLQNIFAALGKDDLQAYRSSVSDHFYIFSGGGRYDAAGFVDAVKTAHAQGIRFEWAVAQPEIHVSCRQAWVTYLNKGSVDTGKGKVPTNWLESAVFEYAHGHWRARFIHSTEESATH